MTPADLLTFDGTTQPISEWALDYGIPEELILERLADGWPSNAAIETPMVVQPGYRLPPKLIDNRRRQMIDYRGECLSASEWGARLGITAAALRFRLKSGWGVERALTEPARRAKPGVASNLDATLGTGAGSAAQEIPEIAFSEQDRT